MYIPFDIGIAWVLWRIVERKYKLLVLGLWLLNPVAIFGIYMMGQFDVIPALFTLLALWALVKESKKGIWLAAILLGVGAAFKIYPLMLLPIVASLPVSWLKKIGIIGLGFSVYIVSISLFVMSPGFRTTALVAGQTTKSLYAQIPLSGGESLMLYIVGLFLVYLLFLVYPAKLQDLAFRMLVVLLVFFGLTHYHPQWFVWAVPFLIINLTMTKLKSLLPQLVLFGSWFGGLWFFDSGMTLGLFSPVWTYLYNGLSVWQLIGVSLDINFARSVLTSAFCAGVVAILVINLQLNNKSKT